MFKKTKILLRWSLLIPIFATHFVQAWLPCGLNSYIILYFILLSMTQAHAIYWGNWESVVWKIWVGSFWTFCMSPTYACYQVGMSPSPQAYEKGLVPRIFTPKELSSNYDLKFLPKPIFAFKHSWLPLANSSC